MNIMTLMNRTHGFVCRSMSATRSELRSEPPTPLEYEVASGASYGLTSDEKGVSDMRTLVWLRADPRH